MADERREYSYDDLFPERWLHAPDLDGRSITLTITDLYAETIVNPKTKKQDECGIVSFKGTKREYVLSKQNAWILKTVFGPKKADVQGKRITLSPVPDTSGFTDHGIRILFTGSPDIGRDTPMTLPGGKRVTFKKTAGKNGSGVEEGSVDAVTGEVADGDDAVDETQGALDIAEWSGQQKGAYHRAWDAAVSAGRDEGFLTGALTDVIGREPIEPLSAEEAEVATKWLKAQS